MNTGEDRVEVWLHNIMLAGQPGSMFDFQTCVQGLRAGFEQMKREHTAELQKEKDRRVELLQSNQCLNEVVHAQHKNLEKARPYLADLGERKWKQQAGCHCPADRCMAPRVMGRQMPCLRKQNA